MLGAGCRSPHGPGAPGPLAQTSLASGAGGAAGLRALLPAAGFGGAALPRGTVATAERAWRMLCLREGFGKRCPLGTAPHVEW